MKDELQTRALLPRKADLTALFNEIHDMHCVSVVGISNVGKSSLLRAMTDPQTQTQYLGENACRYMFVYIDYNQMLDMTEQAFYELVLRCTLDDLRKLQTNDREEVLRQVEANYTGLIAPASEFKIPWHFSQAMAAIGDLLPQRVVFLFDEFDGPIAGIEGRVFLNLRALKDKHQQGLNYITATDRRLEQIWQDADVAEFGELFDRHTHYMSLLTEEETANYVAQVAAVEDVTFSENDLVFIRTWGGGHPGLLAATCRVLGILTGRPVRDSSQDWIIHRRAAEILAHDINVQAECRKIWNDLTSSEQDTLMTLLQDGDVEETPDLESVTAKHMVTGEGPERRIFARAFADFVQRQRVTRQPGQSGVRVDPESGEVWVGGVQIPTLTNLEYRLLLLLYGRLGKICTKYEVVEAVWGEGYIDEVDDARIEKLISRLRQKIEPDLANPRYLLTVRGRGYKLMEG